MYIKHVAINIVLDYTYSTFKRLENNVYRLKNVSSISEKLKLYYFVGILLVMFAFISDDTINNTMQSYLCKILSVYTCFFGFCRCLCWFHILQLVNKYTSTLVIRALKARFVFTTVCCLQQ